MTSLGLAAVLAAPDDDAPRLAYAAAIERTDGPRAELIRVQCEIARLAPADVKRIALRLRERALLDKHEGKWLKPFKSVAVHGWFRRGFVETLRIKSKPFLATEASILGASPVRALWSRDVGNKVAADFAKLALLSRIEHLALPECKLDARGLAAILASPHLQRLKRLGLAYNSLRGAAPMALLAAWPALETLESLTLHANPRLKDDDLIPLLACTRAAKLEELMLGGTLIGLDGMVVLARHCALPALRTLSLTGCRLEGGDLRALRGARGLASLRDLRVSNNPLDGLGMISIVEGTWASTLEALEVSQPDDFPCAFGQLAAAGALPALTKLTLRSSRMDRATVAAIAHRGWSLRELDLGRAPDAASVLAIASSPLASTLEHLRLSMPSGDTSAAFDALLGARWPRLVSLQVHDGAISVAQAERLLDDVHFPALRAATVRGAEAVLASRLPPVLEP